MGLFCFAPSSQRGRVFSLARLLSALDNLVAILTFGGSMTKYTHSMGVEGKHTDIPYYAFNGLLGSQKHSQFGALATIGS